MTRINHLSVCDKLLLAAYGLGESETKPFTAEDLVISAWRMYPDTFGLRGECEENGKPKYPDSNRVFAEIMGSKPIRKRGLLKKVGQKMYALTETGRDQARTLESVQRGNGGEIDQGKSGIDRKVQEILTRLLGSRAIKKVKEGRTDTLTFYDACAFWGIAPQSKSMDLEEELNNRKGVFDIARRYLRNGEAPFIHGEEPFTTKDLTLLENTHTILQEKFKDSLDVIRTRTDQRKR